MTKFIAHSDHNTHTCVALFVTIFNHTYDLVNFPHNTPCRKRRVVYFAPNIARRQAKAINFGVIYGISGFGLARNLRIPKKEALSFIDTYFERLPVIRVYMDETVSFAKENGYVKTLFGRKVHTSEINAK